MKVRAILTKHQGKVIHSPDTQYYKSIPSLVIRWQNDPRFQTPLVIMWPNNPRFQTPLVWNIAETNPDHYLPWKLYAWIFVKLDRMSDSSIWTIISIRGKLYRTNIFPVQVYLDTGIQYEPLACPCSIEECYQVSSLRWNTSKRNDVRYPPSG